MKTTKITNKKTVNVQTYSWERYGNIITDGIVALCEFTHNAYAAAMSQPMMRVSVDIEREPNGVYLYVKNSGNPADIEKVLHYGRKNHGTPLNQFGTGFKTAASFFNPGNDGWEFFTNDNGTYLHVGAPYSNSMEIDEIDEWPFEYWVASCVRVRVDDESRLSGITAEELGYRYSKAIKDDGLVMTFNGQKVKAIEPKGGATSDSAIIDICGESVKFDYTLYTLGEDAANEKYYPMSIDGQGVYVFVNHCLAAKLGTKIIRASGKGNSFLKAHPSMNGLIAVVDIETPSNHNADVPFVNCKDNINWQSNLGKAYRTAIDSLVGDHFRTAHDNALEVQRRSILNGFCQKLFDGVCEFQTECKLSSELRADAVIARERDSRGRIKLDTIEKIVEYKKKKVTAEDVGQVLAYWAHLKVNYQKNAGILLVGSELTKSAQESIDLFGKVHGIQIEFFDWSSMQLV